MLILAVLIQYSRRVNHLCEILGIHFVHTNIQKRTLMLPSSYSILDNESCGLKKDVKELPTCIGLSFIVWTHDMTTV